MGFLKKLKKKLKKAAKKVAKISPAGKIAKTAKAIKKGKPLGKILTGAMSPIDKAISAKSVVALPTLIKTKSFSKAAEVGAQAGFAGAVALAGNALAQNMMKGPGVVLGPPVAPAAPEIGGGGSVGDFFDNIGGYARDAGQFAGEIGNTVGSLRDAWGQFTGERAVPNARNDPPSVMEGPAQAGGLDTKTLLLIGGGLLVVLLIAKR